MTRIGWSVQIFTCRQALRCRTVYKVLREAGEANHEEEAEFGQALQTCSHLLLIAGLTTAQHFACGFRWDAIVAYTLGRQALPMVWDFAEANPFSGGTAGWDGALNG